MTKTNFVIREEEKGILFLSLNRPEKRNALNIALLKEICHCYEEAAKNHAIRAIIIKGEGPIFCSGLDLEEAMDIKVEEESAQFMSHALRAVYDCPALTIAAVHGAALAGGAGLMAACDFTIATESTHFAFPEVKRGLVAAQIASILLRQLSGRHVRELLLLGEMINAEQAVSMGLINKIVPEDSLQNAAYALAKTALRNAPGAMRKTKHVIDILSATPLSDDLMKVMPFHLEARQSPEAKEGMRAFLEKRDPAWLR